MDGLLLWAFLIVIACAATFLTGLICLFLQGRARFIGVNVLIGFMTISVVLGLGSEVVSKSAKKNRPEKVSAEERLRQVELSAVGLTSIAYVDELNGPMKVLLSMETDTKFKDSVKSVAEAVNNILDRYPNDAAVASRLVILKHAMGEDPTDIVRHYVRSGGKSDVLLNTLSALYTVPYRGNVSVDIGNIERLLPDGWYRNTAVLDALKIGGGASLDEALARRKQREDAYVTRLLIIQGFKYSLGLAAIFAMYFYFHGYKKQEFRPFTASFRTVYICLITVFFVQILVGFFAGVVAGICMAFKLITISNSQLLVALSPPVSIAGVITALVLATALVARPQGLALRHLYLLGIEKMTAGKIVLVVLAGLCSMMATSLVLRLLQRFLALESHGPTNPSQINALEAIVGGNLPFICWSGLSACILAPITEELLFRGLLYGMLRSRFNIAVSVILSSLAFAGSHLDMGGFLQYFGLGVIFSLAYERTRCLLISVLMHSLWNTWVMVTMYCLVLQ